MKWRQENGTIHIEIDEADMMCPPVSLPTCAADVSLQMMLYDASTDVFYCIAAVNKVAPQ